MIGVGDLRGVGRGVNAGLGEPSATLGVDVDVAGAPDGVDDAGVEAGAAVRVGSLCGASAGTICPDSKIRAKFSLFMSTSTFPLGGGGGGTSCLPLRLIWILSANPR